MSVEVSHETGTRRHIFEFPPHTPIYKEMVGTDQR